MAKSNVPKIRTAAQAKGDKTRTGKPAKAGKTKSLLEAVRASGVSKRAATTIRAGGGGRAARSRGAINPSSRANSSANSLSK